MEFFVFKITAFDNVPVGIPHEHFRIVIQFCHKMDVDRIVFGRFRYVRRENADGIRRNDDRIRHVVAGPFYLQVYRMCDKHFQIDVIASHQRPHPFATRVRVAVPPAVEPAVVGIYVGIVIGRGQGVYAVRRRGETVYVGFGDSVVAEG